MFIYPFTPLRGPFLRRVGRDRGQEETRKSIGIPALEPRAAPPPVHNEQPIHLGAAEHVPVSNGADELTGT